MIKPEYREAVATEMALPLARYILEAAKVREESFDHAQAAIDKTKHAAERTSPGYPLADYKLTIQQAAEQVCPPQLVEPVAMLLRNNWNESLDWAKTIVL